MRKAIIIVGIGLIMGAGWYWYEQRATRTEPLQSLSTDPNPKPQPQPERVVATEPPAAKPVALNVEMQNKLEQAVTQWYHKPLAQVIKEYQARLQNNPKDVAAHEELGKIYGFFPDKQREALYHLQTVLRLKPDHPQKESIQARISVYLLRASNTDELAKLSKEPNVQAEQYLALGKRYEQQGVIRTAIHYYREAIRLNPNHPQKVAIENHLKSLKEQGHGRK